MTNDDSFTICTTMPAYHCAAGCPAVVTEITGVIFEYHGMDFLFCAPCFNSLNAEQLRAICGEHPERALK